jgi:hypothetical protein
MVAVPYCTLVVVVSVVEENTVGKTQKDFSSLSHSLRTNLNGKNKAEDEL